MADVSRRQSCTEGEQVKSLLQEVPGGAFLENREARRVHGASDLAWHRTAWLTEDFRGRGRYGAMTAE